MCNGAALYSVGDSQEVALSENERATRAQRIGPQLRSAGWPIIGRAWPSSASPAAVVEYETVHGPADYALCKQGRVQTVVEARKITVGPQGVLTQAERYSRGINQWPRYQDEFAVQFVYSTNGEVTHFHDIRRDHNRSRSVSAFHTPTALAKMLTRDADVELARLATFSQYDRLRPYQREANQAIEEATKDGRRRLMVGECRYDPK